MANIRVDLTEPLLNGMDIKFKAPCDCTAITGMEVYAPDNDGNVSSQTFTFKDAHGNALTGLGNLFSKDVLVKVMVDTTNSAAYIQNADTNKYLENKIANAGTKVTLSDSVTSTSSTTAASSKAVKSAYDRAASYVASQRGATNGLAPLQNGKIPEGYLPDSLFVSDQRVQTFSDEAMQTGFINSAEIRFARVGKLVVVEGSFYVNNSNCAEIKISFSGSFPRPSIAYAVLPLGISYNGIVSAGGAPNCPAHLDFNESSSAVKLKWYPNALLSSGFYSFTASYTTDH